MTLNKTLFTSLSYKAIETYTKGIPPEQMYNAFLKKGREVKQSILLEEIECLSNTKNINVPVLNFFNHEKTIKHFLEENFGFCFTTGSTAGYALYSTYVYTREFDVILSTLLWGNKWMPNDSTGNTESVFFHKIIITLKRKEDFFVYDGTLENIVFRAAMRWFATTKKEHNTEISKKYGF